MNKYIVRGCLVVIALFLLGFWQHDDESAAGNTKVASGDTATVKGAFGCLDRATYDRMMEFLDEGGKDAFGKYVLSHLDGGCVFFNDV